MGEACPVENIDIVRWPISSLIYFFGQFLNRLLIKIEKS